LQSFVTGVQVVLVIENALKERERAPLGDGSKPWQSLVDIDPTLPIVSTLMYAPHADIRNGQQNGSGQLLFDGGIPLIVRGRFGVGIYPKERGTRNYADRGTAETC